MKNNTQVRAYIRMLLERFEFNNNKSFTPPQGVVSAASSALEVVANNDLTGGREGDGKHEGSGKIKAQEIVAKTPQTHDQIKRLAAFFNANKSAVEAEKKAGKTINNSPHIQSWELHGGDAGANWAASCLSQTKDGNLQSKENLRLVGGAGDKKGMGTLSKNLMSTKTKNI